LENVDISSCTVQQYDHTSDSYSVIVDEEKSCFIAKSNTVPQYFIATLSPKKELISKVLHSTGMFESDKTTQMKKLFSLYREAKVNATFVDVGANFGTYGLFAAKSGFRTLAVEPSLQNYRLIQRSVALNNLSSEYTCLNIGVGAKTDILYLGLNPNDQILASDGIMFKSERDLKAYSKFGKLRAYKIQIKPFDDLNFLDFGFTRIDMLKIDIEGFEVFFLQGAKQSLLKFRPRHVWAEINHELLKLHGFSSKDVLNPFWEMGYKIYMDGSMTPLEIAPPFVLSSLNEVYMTWGKSPLTVSDSNQLSKRK